MPDKIEEYEALVTNSKNINRVKQKNALGILLKFSTAYPFKWKGGSYNCYFCKSTFRNPNKLNEHTRDTHINSVRNIEIYNDVINVDFTSATCKICKHNLDDLVTFKNHLAEIHNIIADVAIEDGILPYKLNNDVFVCQICNQSFEIFFSLFMHMNTHFSKFICECCGKGFATQQRKYSHIRLHKRGQFPCNICGKLFPCLNTRVNHISKEHQSNKRYKCPVCQEKFISYDSRMKHLKSVHHEKTATYSCSFCSKQFDLSSYRTAHIKREHLKELNYMCTVCGKKFFRRFELTEHMVKHNGERIFQCDICKKSYARRKTLREHLKIHNNDCRFKCSICNRSFIQNSTLKRHMLIHNTVLKFGSS